MLDALLEARGVRVEPFVVVDDPARPVSHTPFPDLGGYDLVAAMGAPWSVYDTATIGSWIGRELALLRDAHARGIPVLGVCFGGQALAAALGGTVERAPTPEIGWHHVDTDAPDVVAPGPWFQWHGDRFSVPSGGVELARSPVGPQAFVHGRGMGLQFHPEVDVAVLADWLDGRDATEPEFARAGADPARILAQAAEMTAVAHANTQRLLDHFLDVVATADPAAR